MAAATHMISAETLAADATEEATHTAAAPNVVEGPRALPRRVAPPIKR